MSVNQPPLINETQLNPSTLSGLNTQSPSLAEPLMERSGPKTENQIVYKRYKWGIGISGVCLIIFLIIGIAGPFIIQATINSLIGKQTVLGKDNTGTWAQLPGDSGTDFVREFSFFNFSNWEDFVLRGEKPEFAEIQGYKISQVQDYIDLDWKENDEVVGVKSWTRFVQKKDSKSLDDTVYVLNPGSLGFWDTIKNSDPSLVLNQGIGITFLNIEALIKNIIIGMTISSQFLPDYETAWALLYEPADIERENAEFIWTDTSHGMSSSGTLNQWILASQKGPNSKQAQNLGNYFTLSSSQLNSLIFSFTTFYEASHQLVMSNYYCFGSNSCSGFDLAIKQFASMGVTNNPPPSKTIEPSPSICMLNVSCKNYFVEVSAYYNYVFLNEEHQEKYKNLTFKESTVQSWFYHDGANININESSIMHIGNLKALYHNGTQYDNDVSNEAPLENIKNRFNLESKAHAYVFWNWIKYIYYQYINRARQGGKTDYTASALFGTQFFYKSWAKTLDRLHILLLKYKLREAFSGTSCYDFFSTSMRIDNNTINQLCGTYNIRSLDDMERLILVCKYKYHDEWNVMDTMVNSSLAMEEFCDRTEEDGFSAAFEKAEIELDTYYECDQTPLPYCSDYQLAAKQWASSNITKNPIPEMLKDFQPSNTIHDWFDDIRPFEYGNWVSKLPEEDLPAISTNSAYRFMSHDNLFSLNTWQQVWLETNKTELVERYGIEHQQEMGRYLRYVVVYVTFDGFVKQRKVSDLLFGYTDPLVDYITKRSPLIGGDPSRPSYIHLNDLNLTFEEAQKYPLEIHTGKNHPERTSYIKSINGKGTINFNTSEWNGNETVEFTESPWAEEVTIIGSDGKQSAPKQHSDPFNISIFVPAAQRSVFANYTGQSIERFGLKTNKFAISDSFFQSQEQNPDNTKYYQKLPGFVNLTKMYSFPIYASKNHFYGLDKNWTDLIDIWNEDHKWKYQASQYDDSFFCIQPYSGVTFQATVYLMLSYYYQPDVIFTTPRSRMLPIFNIYQSGNFTESGADKLLGSLRTGLGAKKVILWVGIVLSILLLASMIILYVMLRRKMVYDKKKQSLIVIEEEDDMEREVV